MRDPAPQIRSVDFSDPADMRSYLDLLDAYSRDPMGAGQPLDDAVRSRLARDLPIHPTVLGLLAELRGQAIGFATCFTGYSTFRAQPLLNIHDIAVLPGWRGRGAADALLAGIEAYARELGCCRITLEVRDDNPRAQGLYARSGFVPAACNRFMEKPL